MLQIFRNAKDINFDKLMPVYKQTNTHSAARNYPDEDAVKGLFRAEEAFEQYIREEFFSISGAYYAVWEVNGYYVSALRMEPHQDGYLLSALETSLEQRRMGYAEGLVLEVVAMSDKPVYAHVFKSNRPSIALHKKCGFQQISDHAVLLDGTVTQKAVTLLYK